MKITMKMYEEYLNGLGVPENDQYKNGGRCRGKNYGSWLRRNDKIIFHTGYNEYVAKLTQQECEKIKTLPIKKLAISETFDYSESLVVKEITDILKQENIETECQVLIPSEFKDKTYEGNCPLVMIGSELDSTFIKDFIEECIPKDKYFLKPCSNYMLGIYPKEEIGEEQNHKVETKLMVV